MPSPVAIIEWLRRNVPSDEVGVAVGKERSSPAIEPGGVLIASLRQVEIHGGAWWVMQSGEHTVSAVFQLLADVPVEPVAVAFRRLAN
ncbi:hypothetical protein D3C84_938460 [compost metagenome]